MSEYLTTGCMMACTFGLTPAPFVALELPGKDAVLGALTVATIEEIVPILNIPPFGMCSSLANPEVAAATAAALGVLTPMPCIPLIDLPWEPPSLNENYAGIPLATVTSRCACLWGGIISVEVPDQTLTSGTP